jgi:(2Fe-2S) ferredoxin/SAM-dependent methyltransferase
MEAFRHHIYVCDQQKPEGAPSCTANGSLQVIEALRGEIVKQGLSADVQVTTCGSLGLCTRGPNMVVYPEGVWYSGVKPGDIADIVRHHLKDGHVVDRLVSGDQPTVRGEIDANKQKMLASFKARDEAGALPDDLHQSINGFRESRVLLTAIELDAFSAVGTGADARAVAGKLGADPQATESLLNALVALGVMTKRDGRFSNAPVAARYLVASAEHDSRAALMHAVHLWSRWSTLTDCVREGTSVTAKQQRPRDDDWTTAFIAAMHKNARLRAPMVVRAVGLDGVRRVLDLGGGSGAYSIAFAKARPDLTAEVLDVASVVPIAQRHIDEAKLSTRVRTRVGDINDDTYGTGYDLVFLSAVCHMNSPDENRALLRKAFAALAPSGRVAIQDFVLNADKTGPKTGALFALNMLVGTRAGSAYSEEEYVTWLGETGFEEAQRVRLPGPTDLLIARRR